MRRRSATIALCLPTALLLPCVARAAAPFVEGPTKESATPFGPAFSAAIGVNNAGVAVGVSGVSNYAQRVVRYALDGSIDLPAWSVSPGNTSNGGFSSAVGVSDDGTIVGASRRYNGTTYVDSPAVYWDAAGAIHLLTPPTPPAGGKSSVTPKAMSRSGVVAADATVYNASNTLISIQTQRFTRASAAPIALDTPGPAALPKQYANAVNNGGTVVGYINPNGSLVATRWRGTGTSVESLTAPETLTSGAGTSAVATAVNDADVTVGYYSHFVGGTMKGTLAARWDAAGNVSPLGSLQTATDGTQYSSPSLINRAGDIAGTSSKYNGSTSKGTFGVRWLPGDTTPTELGNLGVAITTGVVTVTVKAMNAAGTIVGSSSSPAGTRATLWTRQQCRHRP